MNAILKIDGAELEPARLNRESIIALTESAVFCDLGRVEIVDGVLLQMSPAWLPHSRVHSKLNSFFDMHLAATHLVTIDQLVLFGEYGLHAPDIAFFDADFNERRPESSDLRMAVEIADESLGYDLGTKAGRYAAFGVPDYWVVDVSNRRLLIHREPGPDGYGSVETLDWSAAASPLIAPQLVVRLHEIIPS